MIEQPFSAWLNEVSCDCVVDAGALDHCRAPPNVFFNVAAETRAIIPGER
jgi:hypothetical protein